MFLFQNAPAESLEIEALSLRSVGGGGLTAKFDLTLALQEQRGEVDDWVKAIPVWTKGHPLGKENTEGQADDGGGVES